MRSPSLWRVSSFYPNSSAVGVTVGHTLHIEVLRLDKVPIFCADFALSLTGNLEDFLTGTGLRQL